MAINFPSNPSVNDTFTVDDKTFLWTGDYWRTLSSAVTFPGIIKDADNDTKVEVEASSDEDVIRFRTAGTERLQLTSDGHLIPQANVTYDLGSASNRFRDLYLSGSSIDLGGVEITSDGTSLTMPPVSNISGDFTVGTSALHVDHANTRVGIGTTTPSQNLDVLGNTQLRDVFIDSVANWNYGQLRISRNSSNTPNTKIVSVLLDGDSPDDTDFYANINVALRTDSAPTSGSTSSALNAGVEITAPDSVRFGTNGGEKMRIDSNGFVGIGTTSPVKELDVVGTGRFVSPGSGSTGAVIIRQPSGDVTGGFLQWVDNANVGEKGTIYAGPAGDMAIRPSGGSLTVQESYLDISVSSNTTGSTGTTLQKLSNYVGSDLSQQKTFIDFIFTDNNSNNYPQVRIGAEVGQNGDANSQEKEGSGAFVVYTNNATTVTDGSPSDLSERLRVSYHGRTGLGSTNPGAHLELKAANASMDGRLHLNRYTGTAASPGEPTDWPMPTLALRAWDNFSKITMLSIGYSNDAIYQTGNSVWNMRLSGPSGSTSSSSSTHLEFYGPGTLKTGNFTASGTKTFTIAHPLPEMKDTHDLVHSSVEAPQADNLYRGRAVLVDGMATINLDEEAGMTEGTFVLLNRDVQCYVSNENGWTALRGYVDGNILTIEAEDSSCVDNISWLVIGERQDDDMMSSHRTDDDGRLIVEPLTDRQSEDEFNAEVARLEAKKAAEEQVAEEIV